jgi:AcrR family transcriptional regulator
VPDGLRERKRRAAMRRIQESALDLFDERGFDGVSIEEIADRADVSPSSVYRYFGTKEGIVLYDEVDLNFVERVEHELADHPPVAAVRRATAELMAEYFDRNDELTRRKLRYALDDPALRAATLEATDAFIPLVAGALGAAAGRPADDLDVQVAAAVIIAAILAAVRHWHVAGGDTSLEADIDHALTTVQHGLDLD